MIPLSICLSLMSQHAQVIRALATDPPPDLIHWKPNEESWSLLEVVCHLYDEEREDFRVRLKHILDRVEGMPPAIDPQGWVTAREYSKRDLATVLAQFLEQREASLAWLRSLENPDWDAVWETPFGSIHASGMLSAWVAHDLLHIRQLNELHYGYVKVQSNPYEVGYAGDW